MAREATRARDDGELTLADVDRDGAVCDSIASVYGHSRAAFLCRAALGGGTLLGALATPAPGRASSRRDTAVLNFVLTFERLQASFYTEAEQLGALRPGTDRWARVLGAHERAHVRIIKSVLGRAAGPSPFFDFHGITEDEPAFTRTAVAMEDLTTALLTGQVPRLASRALVAAFFSLLSVEARHAAWVRHSVGVLPVGAAFDPPRSLEQVARLVRSTRFVAASPRVTSRRRPPFTG